jgi:hypothetical protein
MQHQSLPTQPLSIHHHRRKKTEAGADGWRAACIHATVVNKSTLEPYFCKFGVGMPIATEKFGLMSEPLAQRIAFDCANEALREVIASPSLHFLASSVGNSRAPSTSF